MEIHNGKQYEIERGDPVQTSGTEIQSHNSGSRSGIDPSFHGYPVVPPNVCR